LDVGRDPKVLFNDKLAYNVSTNGAAGTRTKHDAQHTCTADAHERVGVFITMRQAVVAASMCGPSSVVCSCMDVIAHCASCRHQEPALANVPSLGSYVPCAFLHGLPLQCQDDPQYVANNCSCFLTTFEACTAPAGSFCKACSKTWKRPESPAGDDSAIPAVRSLASCFAVIEQLLWQQYVAGTLPAYWLGSQLNVKRQEHLTVLSLQA
jgi:hypothetical protein